MTDLQVVEMVSIQFEYPLPKTLTTELPHLQNSKEHIVSETAEEQEISDKVPSALQVTFNSNPKPCRHYPVRTILPFLSQSLVNNDTSNTIRKVRQAVREIQTLCNSSNPRLLALSIASYVRELLGLQVKLYVDIPVGKNIPPGWIEGLIVISDPNETMSPTIYVDCGFRTKFLVARPTTHYAHYIQFEIPTVFVGKDKQLDEAIDAIMTELQQSLSDSSLEIPPWRTSDRTKEMYSCCIHSPNASTQGDYLLAEVRVRWRGSSQSTVALSLIATSIAVLLEWKELVQLSQLGPCNTFEEEDDMDIRKLRTCSYDDIYAIEKASIIVGAESTVHRSELTEMLRHQVTTEFIAAGK